MAIDPFALYERAVQCPEHEVRFFERVFRARRGVLPTSLREDFAGTAAVAAAWVSSSPERIAFAVDHDPHCLSWGSARHGARLSSAERARLFYICADVHHLAEQPVDVVAAENFSWCIFHERGTLRTYLEVAHANLTVEGALILDVQGGPSTHREGFTEERTFDDFVMRWEHERFDPVTHRVRFRMHFAQDGEVLQDAFTYDWRLWSVPELTELCYEAGFSAVEVWWQDQRERSEGQFRKVVEAPATELWVAYVVAFR